jgi:hypothetical protein
VSAGRLSLPALVCFGIRIQRTAAFQERGLTLPSSGPAYGRPLKSNVRRHETPPLTTEARQSAMNSSHTRVLAIVALTSQLIGPRAIAQGEGDPYIIKRGWVFVTRIAEPDRSKPITGTEYTEYYVGQRSPKVSLELLSVRLPNTRIGSQLSVGTYQLDCTNGAIRWASTRNYDGSWNQVGTEIQLKGSKWERPMPGTLNAFIQAVGCG